MSYMAHIFFPVYENFPSRVIPEKVICMKFKRNKAAGNILFQRVVMLTKSAQGFKNIHTYYINFSSI